MAKSSNSKVVSTTPQNDAETDAGKSSSKDKTGSKSSSKQSMKGYVYLDHPPDLPDLIIGDPTSPQNIIHGKRTRNASNVNESHMGKAPRAIKAKDDDEAKATDHRANVEAASSATPGIDKAKASKKVVGDPPPKEYDVPERPVLHEEEDSITTQEEISAEEIRRSVLALVNRSLQVATDVAAYMHCVEDHEVQGQKLDGDVARVLSERVAKRKAVSQKGKSGKVARFAL
jgi:hypothetical protein